MFFLTSIQKYDFCQILSRLFYEKKNKKFLDENLNQSLFNRQDKYLT
jgi:hypothetical protein